ncbi:hypothetical protein LTR91_025004 [Friedmanniomyces endolithicus]|uniref:NAD(P)-binding protein n=1 Tax=Friedmanniomyces endolithicus TaxID=329885 RepID=A0AAN6F334_9PEZI|nr:hypothetical protein LTR35_018090 [Friedmanniomyces endolithicus]KAK0266964.1 hypothetical protein LTS00_017902 [Friedmanniomyces endolithicus]KAK0301981.1 hypothetical protein LTR82_018042 [Friedmanniomyces endolithicus]KAK0890710.1 hypothetical protein LTR57_025034 [Friedmanniomyces endolithicus]KAK0951405.1 hypothetical protein LTR91_025004 [Friedmanniomyces endolithicus]
MIESTLQDALQTYPAVDPAEFAGKLKGQVAIVTGTSAGTGIDIAKALANAGAKVACVARRDVKPLVEYIKSKGGEAIAISEDVAVKGAAQRIVAKVESELGTVNILINNAGISRLSPVAEEPEDMDIWWRVHEVNVYAPVMLTRAVLPAMLKRGSGYIISVSSSVLYMTLPCMSAYSSSKAAITKFHEALAIELRDTGVYSFSTTPGVVKTELGASENALNKGAMEDPNMKAFMAGRGKYQGQDADVLANAIVAMTVDDSFKSLNGKFINASKDLTAVMEEARKEGAGRIGAEDMYAVRMHQL